MRIAMLVAATLGALSLTSSGARADGPWCAYYTYGASNCGFQSHAQCMAAISGTGGSCGQNPNYRGSGDGKKKR